MQRYCYNTPVRNLFLFLFLFSLSAFAQDDSALIASFPTDLERVMEKNFTEEQLNEFNRKYSNLLSANDEVVARTVDPTRSDTKIYPLYEFRKTKLYQENIDSLLQSSNPNHRLVSVVMVGASGNISREGVLLAKLKSEEAPGVVVRAGMALLELKTSHTTELFDFLVKYEEFGDAHMIPFFFGLDAERLRQTAYERIGGTLERERILAAQTLSVTTANPTTEQILKKGVLDWEPKLKGYAIYSMKALRVGNLLDLLKPLIDDLELRGISLAALANSSTERDRTYAIEFVDKQETVPSELLNSLFDSEDPGVLSYWLKCLYTKKIAADHFIFLNEQPLIASDALLADVQKALKNIEDPKLLAQLVEALRGRTDTRSIDIIISFLNHPNSWLRYSAASVTRDNPAKRLQEPAVKKLIQKNLKN